MKKYSWLFYIVIFIGVLVLFCLFIPPKIKLVNKETIVELGIGEKYVEPGYSANYLIKDLTSNVKVKNNINVNKMGKYEVNYSLKFGLYNIKAKRNVIVKDAHLH